MCRRLQTVRLLALLVLGTAPAAAQFTIVTGTVTDPNGIPYAAGIISAALVTPGGSSATLNGLPCCSATAPVALDSTGSFTMRLADNSVILPGGTQWQFSVSHTGVPPPWGFGPQSFTSSITISGASQSVSTTLSAAAPALTRQSGPGLIISAKKLNNIRFASAFTGADLGAQINAADTDLGATAGEIWVTASGTLTTQVLVTSNHTLRFLGNITITFPTTLQVAAGQSNIGIYCSGPNTVFNNTQTGYSGGAQTSSTIQIGVPVSGYGQNTSTSVAGGTAAAGSTNIQVTSSTGFTVGDEVKLNDTRYNEWNEISAIPDGTHLTMKYPTQYPYTTSTTIYDFPPAFLTKNVTVQGCRFTSTTTSPSATGSGVGVEVIVGKYVNVIDNFFENQGSRAILVSSGASPSGNALIRGNHVRNCGLVPVGGGSPCIETYIGSNNNSVSSNVVEDFASHAYSVHGFGDSWTGNAARGGLSAQALGMAIAQTEDIAITGNTFESVQGCITVSGAASEGLTEGKSITISGNHCNEATQGYTVSSSYTRVLFSGNYAHRCGIGFSINTGIPDVHLTGNHVELSTTGYSLISTGTGGVLSGNFSQGNTTGYALNSPSNLNFVSNTSESDTTAITLGGSGNSNNYLGNMLRGYVTATTGSVGTNSTVLGTFPLPDQLSTGNETFGVNGNPITGVTNLTMTGTLTGLAVGRTPVTIANGLNSNINIGTATFISLTGQTAAFSIGGFIPPANSEGRPLCVFNTVNTATMTIVNLDGSSTAANRIFTNNGGNVTMAQGQSFACFQYETADNLWILAGEPSQPLTGSGAAVRATSPTIVTPTVSGALGKSGTAPVISGTGCSLTSGTDMGGTIATSASTTCTVTFAVVHAAAPSCTVSDTSTTSLTDVGSISTSALVINISAALTGNVYYHCDGN